MLDLERSKGVSESTSTERLAQITQLQRRVDEQRVHEGLVRELRERVRSLEEQLTRLRSEVGGGREGGRDQTVVRGRRREGGTMLWSEVGGRREGPDCGPR